MLVIISKIRIILIYYFNVEMIKKIDVDLCSKVKKSGIKKLKIFWYPILYNNHY